MQFFYCFRRFNIFRKLYSRIRKYSISAKYNIAKSIIELILIYFFIAFGLDGFELRYYPLMHFLLTLIIFVLIIMMVSKETVNPQTQRLSVKRVLTFSSSILFRTCLMIFFNQFHRYFVAGTHSEELSDELLSSSHY